MNEWTENSFSFSFSSLNARKKTFSRVTSQILILAMNECEWEREKREKINSNGGFDREWNENAESFPFFSSSHSTEIFLCANTRREWTPFFTLSLMKRRCRIVNDEIAGVEESSSTKIRSVFVSSPSLSLNNFTERWSWCWWMNLFFEYQNANDFTADWIFEIQNLNCRHSL